MSNGGAYDPSYGATSNGSQPLGAQVSAARASLDQNLRAKVEQNPWGVLGIAVAAGYVAGGGLFTPLTAKLVGLGVRLGLRLALVPMVRNELAGLVGSARQGVAS